MFIFLLHILLNMKLTSSTLIIQSAGVYDIKNDDIAMIFYLTVENSFDHEIHVSVYGLQCMEGDPYYESVDHMFLIGGDMNYIDSKSIRNLTLIYPNLYLRNRIGKCIVSLHFITEKSTEEMRKEIFFDTSKSFTVEEQGQSSSLESATPEDCTLDCVIKYSSRKSYYNKEMKRCQLVPECPPDTVYIPKSNTCRKLHVPVCKSDLEIIEDGHIERCHAVANSVNFYCHHGTIGNVTGECICDEGWTTSTCSEGVYHPTLNLYHMCNIEVNTWDKANREKLIMTILVLVILAFAIAAKMLLAICILNWCCHFIKSRNENDVNEEYCGSYTCPYSYCGDEECTADKPENSSSRIIKVSFSNICEMSGDGESDVTVTIDGQNAESTSTGKGSRSSANICHCK